MNPAHLSRERNGIWRVIDRCRHSDRLAFNVFLGATIQNTNQTWCDEEWRKSFGIRDRLLAAEAYSLAFSRVVAELSLSLPIFAFAKSA